MAYEKNHVIYETSLSIEQLIEAANYGMDDEDYVAEGEFTEKEIDQLADDIQDAVQGVIEDFLNHRDGSR